MRRVSSATADSGLAVTATLITGAFIAVAVYVAPAMVTAYSDQLHFSGGQPGYVIAAEMVGMGLATFPALWWISRLPWGRVASIVLLAVALGDAVSIFAISPGALAAVRFLTGVAEGTVSVVCMSALRLTRDPSRSFGLWLFGQLLVGALALAALPLLLAHAGVAGFFGVLAVIALLLAWPAARISSGHDTTTVSALRAERGWAWPALCGLAAVLAFYVAFSGIWTFVGKMGSSAGFSAAEASYALSLAPVGGMIGAALAAVLGVRLGGAAPLFLGITVLSVAVYVLQGTPNLAWYVAATVGLMFAWTFAVPYLVGGIAAVDGNGRSMAMLNIVIGAGFAVGPAVGGLLVAQSTGYEAMAKLSIGLCVTSFLLALPMLRAAARGPQSR